MESLITALEDGIVEISIDFSDEDIELTATTTVIGGEHQARAYIPIFAADIRARNRHLFPDPVPPAEEEEGEGAETPENEAE